MKKNFSDKSGENAPRERTKPNPFKSNPGKKALNERSKARLSGQNTAQKPEGRKGNIPDEKKLKVIGHQLKPCVLISEGSVVDDVLNESVIKEAKARLEDHELIKVKVRFVDRDDRLTVIKMLIDATGARQIHQIGKIVLLFKASTRFSAKLSNIERHRQLI